MCLKKRVTFLALILVLLSLFSSIALAADFRMPDESGDLALTRGESTKNLFVSGNSVKVLSDVKGDLFIFGNMVSVAGDVENNLFICGNV